MSDCFSGSFSQWATSATDSVDFAGFWNSLSDATSPRWSEQFLHAWYYTDFTDTWAWVFKKEEGIDLAPTEKNVIDYPKGKLRMPKPQCPRGFKHLTLRNEFSGPHFR